MLNAFKKCDTLDETLGGNWRGLYGEVVASDCYRLRKVPFVPDIVFDIGANVGTFARFARELWPRVPIWCVEPDPLNCYHFLKFTEDENIMLIQAALGSGLIYQGSGHVNGSGATFLSESVGYPLERLNNAPELRANNAIPFMQLSDLAVHCNPTYRKALIKIDCEGAENCIWTHEPSMAFLRSMDYIAIEVHFYAATGIEWPEMARTTHAALQSLKVTHDCELENVHFWATKRNDPTPSGTL